MEGGRWAERKHNSEDGGISALKDLEISLGCLGAGWRGFDANAAAITRQRALGGQRLWAQEMGKVGSI